MQVCPVPQAPSWSEGLKEQGYTLTGSKAARVASPSALCTFNIGVDATRLTTVKALFEGIGAAGPTIRFLMPCKRGVFLTRFFRLQTSQRSQGLLCRSSAAVSDSCGHCLLFVALDLSCLGNDNHQSLGYGIDVPTSNAKDPWSPLERPS